MATGRQTRPRPGKAPLKAIGVAELDRSGGSSPCRRADKGGTNWTVFQKRQKQGICNTLDYVVICSRLRHVQGSKWAPGEVHT